MPEGTRQGLSPENANGTHVFAGLGHSGLKALMREVSQGSVTHYRIMENAKEQDVASIKHGRSLS